MSKRWQLTLQAIRDRRAEWRVHAVDSVFMKEDANNDSKLARIKEVLEGLKQVEIKEGIQEGKPLAVASRCNVQ